MSKTGVIFQGPLVHHGQSVFPTISKLIQMRKDLEIVVSTNIESYVGHPQIVKNLSQIGIEVIFHPNLPPVKDKARNHFIRNMLFGTQIALEHMDSDYVFRFRSDHQVRNIHNFVLPEAFGPDSKMRSPICISSFGTHHRALGQLRSGCISDHAHFGNRQDLLNYWHLDGLTEELISKEKRWVGAVPTDMRYFVEQILYLAWRRRIGFSEDLNLPKRRIWESEFASLFRMITPQVVDVNLHSNLEIWTEIAEYDGSFLKLSTKKDHQLNYRLAPFQILDNANRWARYLRHSTRAFK
jgi:hypothetical protein